MRVLLLGAGPGLYFNLATLSSQVPSTGSAAQTANAEPSRMSESTRLKRAHLEVFETAQFSICPPVLGAVYTPTGAGSRGVVGSCERFNQYLDRPMQLSRAHGS